MSQHDYVIANASGATVRADLNSLFQAMLSQNSGTSAPTSTAAGMFWLDTTGGAPYTLKIRDAGNNHWLTVLSLTDPGSDGDAEIVAPLVTKGGTGQTSWTQGDVLYASGSNALAKLGAGTSGQFLKTQGSGTNPVWSDLSNFPANHLLQTVSASFNGIQTIGMTSVTDVTSLSCSMTITSGNKVLIFANLNVGTSADAFGKLLVTDGSNNVILQNSTGTGSQVNASMAVTPAAVNPGDINYSRNYSFNHLWTPGVTSITVKIRGLCTYSSSDSIYINMMETSSNASHVVRGTSGLTIMEVQS